MSTNVVMPRLSDSMEEGILARWLRHDKDEVRNGDPIAEVETDKTTLEITAETDGILRTLVQEGDTVLVGEALAFIAEAGDQDDATGPASEASSRATAPPPSNQPSAPTAPKVTKREVGVVIAASHGRLRATPVARKLAREAGVDIEAIGSGSGPEGRVHRIDVERWLSERRPPAIASTDALTRDTVAQLTRNQELTARRVTESKQQIPHYYVSTEVDMTQVAALRGASPDGDWGPNPSVTDLVVLACGRALREVPEVNASWIDGRVVRRGSVNVGIAVALEDGGLVVPVIKHADELRVSEIASLSRELVAKAREGRLTPGDVEGSTFTVSNLGMFGVTNFHAIINPPESGILAVGATAARLILDRGTIVERPTMTISLSADHRVYSGVTAARFVDSVRRGLESVHGLAG
jgi:pyruvate dehydrogenase E2 component (dihydrolipoamide acetyltransferase)